MSQATYDKHSIVTTTTWIAAIVAITMALILPLGYFTLSYQYLVGSLETESEMTSSIITRLINSNPEMWHFEQVRLEELLEQRKHSNHMETQRIYDLSGTLIAESDVGLRPPLVTRRFNLLEAGKVVGTLEIHTSLHKILFNSGLIALLGLLFGSLIFVTLRVLPLRAVVAAEKSLRDSETRYRLLVENAPDAILVYGRESILYANIAALILFRATNSDQLVGQSVTTICKSENHELAGKCLQISDETSGASSQQEMQLTCLDGVSIQVIAVGISTMFQNEPAVQVILHDISERKRLMDELQDKIMLLEAARANVRHLEGIIPICMYCKKIRDDEESWQQMESYISQHSEALFSHGICPDCFPKAKSEAMKEWN
jgi:PAS domain S-box-containing protein